MLLWGIVLIWKIEGLVWDVFFLIVLFLSIRSSLSFFVSPGLLDNNCKTVLKSCKTQTTNLPNLIRRSLKEKNSLASGPDCSKCL